jgi:tungstate transport system permease protein
MNLIWEGLREAFYLVYTFDPLVIGAALRTLWISSLAVAFSTALGLPVGTALARLPIPGAKALVMIARTSMAVPTVFIGIVCYAMFSRRGPLGPFEILYTPWAIVIGEVLLALPVVLSLSHGAVKALDPRVAETAFTLGAGALRRWGTYLSEARTGILLAVLNAFARCVTELGIAMMVGGNIKGRTRTLATATALETSKGEFGRGMAMGLILLVMALGVTALVVLVSREEKS